MNANDLSAIAGLLLSLAFSYIPGLSPWFDMLDGIRKRLIMLGLLAVVAIGTFGLACAGWGVSIGLSVTCDQAGAIGLVRSFMVAMIANQAMFLITPRKSENSMKG